MGIPHISRPFSRDYLYEPPMKSLSTHFQRKCGSDCKCVGVGQGGFKWPRRRHACTNAELNASEAKLQACEVLRNWAVSVLANMLSQHGVGMIYASDCIVAEEHVLYSLEVQAERSVWERVWIRYRV